MKYYSVSEISVIAKVTKRAIQYRIKRLGNISEKDTRRDGNITKYSSSIVKAIGVQVTDTTVTDKPAPAKETKKLKKTIQNLETEIQMLTFQLSLKMEQEKELKKDKDRLHDTIDNLSRLLLESQSNTQRAQTLQYLDKDKKDERR